MQAVNSLYYSWSLGNFYSVVEYLEIRPYFLQIANFDL